MSVNSKKTILLEKKYLYVRASLGFQLEGTSTEIIPTNNGFYRFYVDNLSNALGNSYVNIIYDSSDLSFQSFCSDLYMDELMSSDSSAIEDVVEELKKNTTTIEGFESGVSSAMLANHQDNVAIQNTSSSINDSIHLMPNNSDLTGCFLVNYSKPSAMPYSGDIFVHSSDFVKANAINKKYYAHYHFDCYNRIDNESLWLGFCFGDSRHLSTYIPDRVYYRLKLLEDDGSIVYQSGYKTSNKGSGSVALVVSSSTSNFKGYLLSCDFYLLAFENFVSALNFYDGKLFSKSSFKDNVLFLYPYGDISSSLFQNFDYDFAGGYLDFRFCSNLSVDFLKSFTYVFLTDCGEVSFTGVELGLHYLPNTNLVICTNFPNIVSPSEPLSVKKLLGIRVKKDEIF